MDIDIANVVGSFCLQGIGFLASIITIGTFISRREKSTKTIRESISGYRSMLNQFDAIELDFSQGQAGKAILRKSIICNIYVEIEKVLGAVSSYYKDKIRYLSVAFFSSWSTICAMFAYFYWYLEGSLKANNLSIVESNLWVLTVIESIVFFIIVVACMPYFTFNRNRFFKINRNGKIERINYDIRLYSFINWATSVLGGFAMGIVVASLFILLPASYSTEYFDGLLQWVNTIALIPLVLYFLVGVLFVYRPRRQYEEKANAELASKFKSEGISICAAAANKIYEKLAAYDVDKFSTVLDWTKLENGIEEPIEAIHFTFANKKCFDALRNWVLDGANSTVPSAYKYYADLTTSYIVRKKLASDKKC